MFDAGVLSDQQLADIVTDLSELAGWKVVEVGALADDLRPTVAARVQLGLSNPGIYLENGRPLGS